MATAQPHVPLGDSAPIGVRIEYTPGRFSARRDRRCAPFSRGDRYDHEPRGGVAVYPDGTVPGAGGGDCAFTRPLSAGNSAYTGGSSVGKAIPGMGRPAALLYRL